ncbi:hypothetical protein KQI84_06815 [bacterium]|nr:hypothetical protein [bacterium]
MAKKAPLTPDQEDQCLAALEVLGITRPDHPLISNHGYFALYMTGLTADEMGEGAAHPDVEAFMEIRKLLSRAGAERLRELLAKRVEAEKQPIRPSTGVEGIETPSSAFRTPTPGIADEVTLVEGDEEEEEEKYQATHTPHPHKVNLPKSDLDVKSLDPADTEEAITYILQLRNEGRYQDAYYVVTAYFENVGLSSGVLEAGLGVIERASSFDREQGVGPVNMLHECEHLAATIVRFIPEVSRLSKKGDAETVTKFRMVAHIYETWLRHCRALVEYKYRIRNDEWMRRQWVEPSDFGFVLDVFRSGARTNLPMEMMRRLYKSARHVMEVGEHVIAFPDKQGKFEAEFLRIVISPLRENYEKLAFDVACDIVRAYHRAGDLTNANNFLTMASSILPDNPEIDRLRARLQRARHQDVPDEESDKPGAPKKKRWWDGIRKKK